MNTNRKHFVWLVWPCPPFLPPIRPPNIHCDTAPECKSSQHFTFLLIHKHKHRASRWVPRRVRINHRYKSGFFFVFDHLLRVCLSNNHTPTNHNLKKRSGAMCWRFYHPWILWTLVFLGLDLSKTITRHTHILQNMVSSKHFMNAAT